MGQGMLGQKLRRLNWLKGMSKIIWLKIAGNTIENLIEVKLDGDSKNHNFKIKLILYKTKTF